MNKRQASTGISILRLTFLIGLLVGLDGCRYLGGENGPFRDRSGDYKEAASLPDMRIPPELDSYTLDALYVIPQPLIDAGEVFEDIPLPRELETRRQQGVRIQALSGRRWIVLDATPGQVWPLVRDYWTSLQIQLDYENPGTGIIETAWLAIGDNGDLRHKYRLSIEPGLHSGYSEIYITHLQQDRSEPVPVVVNWPDSSVDPDMEQQVLTSISQYLADRNDVYQASTASLLAGSIEAASKANIKESPAGESVLELRVDFNRAWVIVRDALEEGQVEILDSDRDQSFYNVRFAGAVEEIDEPGFFGRLLGGGRGSEPAVARDFAVRLLEEDGVVNVVAEELDSSGGDDELRRELLRVINSNLG